MRWSAGSLRSSCFSLSLCLKLVAAAAAAAAAVSSIPSISVIWILSSVSMHFVKQQSHFVLTVELSPW